MVKTQYEIRERLNQEIKRPLSIDDSFDYGKNRGWLDALKWVLYG